MAVFADDGEKFGSWPDTLKPVYEEGWLRQFFDLVRENADWIQVTTPSETIDHVAPLGTLYIPEGSYREMTEWVLPPEQHVAYEDARGELKNHPQWPTIAGFVHGGTWRNFLTRYPEANEMYARMMMVSRRLESLESDSGNETAPRLSANGGGVSRRSCSRKLAQNYIGAVQLLLLARSVWRHLSAAFAQCDLSASDRGGKLVRSRRGAR